MDAAALTLVPEIAPELAPKVADPRVTAVLEVLGGSEPAAVARRWAVDPAVLQRWVGAFVDAGAGVVANRPNPDAAKQRDRFLAAFAHELRTPLAVAQGWVAMLEDEELDPMVTRTVQRLGEALTRLAERTFDVELLAAASLGLLRLTPRTVTVRELVAGLAAPPGEELVEQPGLDVRVTVDPTLFARVLRDLWQAARSIPQPRSLRLEVVAVPPWTELRIIRDADPIEPQVLQALFEPFDLNDDATGVTIGLYLARALTVAHGGTLGIEQDDQRAVLWVRIPAASPAIHQHDTYEHDTPQHEETP